MTIKGIVFIGFFDKFGGGGICQVFSRLLILCMEGAANSGGDDYEWVYFPTLFEYKCMINVSDRYICLPYLQLHCAEREILHASVPLIHPP